MWTKANRGKYNRDGQRYPSDLTDAEWEYVEPLIPPAKHGGRRREVDILPTDSKSFGLKLDGACLLRWI